MIKHLLLVGAGHAHLTILKNLRTFLNQRHRVTVINAENYHYYSGMGPGMLSGFYGPEDVRFHIKQMVKDQGGKFIRDYFVKIDPDQQIIQTRNGEVISYDVVSFNIGSYVPYPKIGPNLKNETFVFPVKPIENLLLAKNKLEMLLKAKQPAVLVAGGGAAGVELSSNIATLAKRHNKKVDVTLLAGGVLLKHFDDSFRMKAKTILKKNGIKLLEHSKATAIFNHYILLDSRVQIPCDMIFWAAGILPSPFFKSSGLPTGPDGGLLVNRYLQCESFPNIFGGGDCISFQENLLDKVGVYAVRQNPVLFKNLCNFMDEKPLRPFVPQKDYLTILNMGDGNGLMEWKSFSYSGPLAFFIKNFIDKKFMKTFQTSKERDNKVAA